MTVRQLEEALSKDPPRDLSLPRWTEGLAEVMVQQAEGRAAPIVTRDALLAMLGEMRRTTRWAKGAFFAAVIVPVAIFVADRLI